MPGNRGLPRDTPGGSSVGVQACVRMCVRVRARQNLTVITPPLLAYAYSRGNRTQIEAEQDFEDVTDTVEEA